MVGKRLQGLQQLVAKLGIIGACTLTPLFSRAILLDPLEGQAQDLPHLTDPDVLRAVQAQGIGLEALDFDLLEGLVKACQLLELTLQLYLTALLAIGAGLDLSLIHI